MPLSAQNGKSKYATVELKTSAHCQSCKDKIEKNLSFEKGIKSAVVNLETKVATIVFNPKKTNIATIKAFLVGLGYEAAEVKGKCCNSGTSSGCQGKPKETKTDCKQ